MSSRALAVIAVYPLLALSLLAAGPARGDEPGEEEARKFVSGYLDARVQKDGAFRYDDRRAGAVLELAPDGIRVVRQVYPYGFFVCAEFHAKGTPGKPYDLDFWLKPAGERFELVDVRVHKAPKRDGDGWKLVTRSPLLWWWIPATEHPGETEEKRGWQVESALHEHIARKAKDGVLTVKDDKTGRDLALEFVEIHKPLRKIEGKGYFACSDFREPGSSEKFYDLDFWLVEKDGQLQVTQVRVHKEPQLEDGHWTQVSRYSFEKDGAKEVP